MATGTSTKRSSKRGTTKGRAQGKSRSSGGRSSGGASARGAASKITWDHDEIRRWAEQRGGKPACVKGTGGDGDEGVLRIDFPGYSGGDSLQHIDWEEWFNKFDGAYLALVYQNKTRAGQRSNFNKLVSRSEARRAATRSGGSRRSGSRAGGTKSRSKSAAGRHGRSR
jgi:hypothetical protein